MKKVTKLVLPMAGLGKRLLPLTDKTPKNLLEVNGKPLLEYVLEEALGTDIREVVFIINPAHKREFGDYLKKAVKKFPVFRFFLRVQKTPAGNGHALLAAADVIGKEPFAVRFCDDIIIAEKPVLGTLLSLFETYSASVLLLEKVPMKSVSRYGVVGVKKPRTVAGIKGEVYEVTEIVEKPKKSRALSDLIIIGGYVLSPSVLSNLERVARSLPHAANDALPLAVGLQIDLIIGNKIYGWEFAGKRLDCGTLENFMKAHEVIKKIAGNG